MEGRRYSSVIAVDEMPSIQSVPTEELGEALPTALNNTTVNVRDWNGTQVVAIARDGDNLLVLPLDGLSTVFELPLVRLIAEIVSEGRIEGYSIQTRIVTLESGDAVNLLPLGPQTQLLTMIDSSSAQSAIIAPIEDVVDGEVVPCWTD